MVPRIRRDHEGLVPQTQQVVGAHQPQHSLVIDGEAVAVQLERDPAVPVGGELQRDLLHLIAQLHLYREARRRHAPAIVTGPARPVIWHSAFTASPFPEACRTSSNRQPRH